MIPALGETFTADEVRDSLRSECEDAGGQSAWAVANKISAAYVCDVLHGRREPGHAIITALGFKKTVLYEAVAPVSPSGSGE